MKNKKIKFLTLLLLFCLFSANTITVLADISVSEVVKGFSPYYGVAVNSTGDRIFYTSGASLLTKDLSGNNSGAIVRDVFSNARGVAVGNGCIYVADYYNGVVKKVDGSNNVTVIASGFTDPHDVAVDRSGNFYVADSYNNAIVKYNSNGEFLKAWQQYYHFKLPRGVAVDSIGKIYVADSLNGAIKIIDTDNSVSTFATGLNNPIGIDVDTWGNVYVAEYGANTIKKITPNGQIVILATDLDRPSGLAVYSGFSIVSVYFADSNNCAIKKITIPREKPRISTQPLTQSISASDSVSFSVVAAGTEPITYQWKKDGVNIEGAITPTLNITNAQAEHAGTYIVEVSNEVDTSYSTPAELTVSPSLPIITTQPQSQAVKPGQNAVFSVVAKGTEPLEYHWHKDGHSLDDDTDKISGVKSSTLRISNVQEDDVAFYTVAIINSEGVVASDLSVSLKLLPTIQTHPIDQSVLPGESASFSVVATGTGTLSYQWQKDGSDIIGATSATLELQNIQASDMGDYRVVVSSSVGSETSNIAKLRVAPAITTQPISQTVMAGEDAVFTVEAKGTEPFSYQWKKNDANISGATSSTLTLVNVQADDAASYSVDVENEVGNVLSSEVALTVNASAPTITTPPTTQELFAGEVATFTVEAKGTEPFSYQWKKNDANISGATSSTLTLVNVQVDDIGSYSVDVGNEIGNELSSGVTLTVNASAPTITTQPINQIVSAGETAIFSAKAKGTEPFSYQWKKNDANISGAISSTLTIENVQVDDVAIYSVVVSNIVDGSESTSLDATLNVAPKILTQPEDQIIFPGESASFSVIVAGEPPLKYQWKKENNNISGATSDTLNINNVQELDGGMYSVIVENDFGCDTSDQVELTVMTDDLCVQADKENLKIIYSGSDNASRVMRDVGLSSTGEYDTNITWQSDKPDVIDNAGKVRRPPHNVGDETVTLTAILGKGATFDTKDFVLTVKRSPEPEEPKEDVDRTLDNNEQEKKTTIRLEEGTKVVTTQVTVEPMTMLRSIVKARKEQKPVVVDISNVITEAEQNVSEEPVQQKAKLMLTANQVQKVAEVGLAVAGPQGTQIELPKALLEELSKAKQDLNIEVSKVPNEEIAEKMEQDDTVYEARDIDTNFSGETKLRFTAPADAKPEELKIRVVHSDGTIEEITPTVVTDAEGNAYLEFTVDKFSTFIVYKSAQENDLSTVISLTVDKSKAIINNEEYDLDAAPFINKSTNRTLVPVRFVSEVLGAEVKWLPATRQVEIKSEGKEILLTIDSDIVLVDVIESTIDSPAEILGVRTFVPLRFVSETLGAKVQYVVETREIILVK